jgi:hypothetical protein
LTQAISAVEAFEGHSAAPEAGRAAARARLFSVPV